MDESWRLSRDEALRQRDECRKARAEAEATIAELRAIVSIVERHTHQGMLAMTYHAGPDPENDCLLCRALVAAGVLTLDQIGSGTRCAILAAPPAEPVDGS